MTKLRPVIKYQEFIPHTVLRDYVKRFWVLEKEYTAEDSVEEVTPDACVELILNFGSPYVQVEGTKRRELPKVCLVGLQSTTSRLSRTKLRGNLPPRCSNCRKYFTTTRMSYFYNRRRTRSITVSKTKQRRKTLRKTN